MSYYIYNPKIGKRLLLQQLISEAQELQTYHKNVAELMDPEAGQVERTKSETWGAVILWLQRHKENL